MIDATPLLAWYASRRRGQLTGLDPRAAQERELKTLVRRAIRTRFGRDHQFDRIDGVAAFQDRVPLTDYHGLFDAYWDATIPT